MWRSRLGRHNTRPYKELIPKHPDCLGPFIEQESVLRESEQELGRLIDRAGRGDQTAIVALYDHTSSLVYNLALNILGDASAAEKIPIKVYTHVYRQVSTYDPSKEAPLAWLSTLTRNQATERLHGMEAQQREGETPTKLQTVDAFSLSDSKALNAAAALRNMIGAALASLGAEQRQVMELACCARLTPAEIAARLELPVESIKMHLRAGMVALRSQLRPLIEKGIYDSSLPDR